MSKTYERFAVKQIINVPDDVTILSCYTDDDDGTKYWAPASEFGELCTCGVFDEATVDCETGRTLTGSACENVIGLLTLDEDGVESHEVEHKIVPTRYCPQCKSKFSVYAKNDAFKLLYWCPTCGTRYIAETWHSPYSMIIDKIQKAEEELEESLEED